MDTETQIRIPPPPRTLTPGLVEQLKQSQPGAATLGFILVLVALVVVGVLVFVGLPPYLQDRALDRRHVLVEATVNRVQITGERRREGLVYYAFIAADGREYEGHSHLRRADRYAVGGPVSVEYHPDRPTLNRIEGTREGSLSEVVSAGVLAVLLAGLGVFLLCLSGRTGWRQSVCERGEVAIGVVVGASWNWSVTAKSRKKERKIGYTLRYKYHDGLGREHTTWQMMTALPYEHAFNEGDTVHVLYDPARPRPSEVAELLDSEFTNLRKSDVTLEPGEPTVELLPPPRSFGRGSLKRLHRPSSVRHLLALVGLVLLAFVVLFAKWGFSGLAADVRLSFSHQETDGEVTEVQQVNDSRYVVRFEFGLPDGAEYTGRSFTDIRRRAEACRDEPSVTIEHAASNPDVNRVRGMRASFCPVWTVPVLVGVFVVPALLLPVVSRISQRRLVRLVRFGQAARGVVLAAAPVRVPWARCERWAVRKAPDGETEVAHGIRYRFADDAGRERESHTVVFAKPGGLGVQRGDPVTVLYDAAHPKRTLLADFIEFESDEGSRPRE